MADANMVEQDENVSGFKSSEFWVAAGTLLLTFFQTIFPNTEIPQEAFWALLSYILGRSGIKIAVAGKTGVKK
jgi:hypothetical protein